jgi:hypothetical protein
MVYNHRKSSIEHPRIGWWVSHPILDHFDAGIYLDSLLEEARNSMILEERNVGQY